MATTRTTTEVTYFLVRNNVEMVQALAELLTLGHRGKIEAYLNLSQVTVWQMEVNGPGAPSPVIVGFGDVIVWDETFLRVMAVDEFSAIADAEL